MRLFAVGDIHGCMLQLKELLEEKIKISVSDKVVLLGDYLDRGPDIKGTIDYILLLKEKGFNIVTLMGNHESMMIESFRTGDFSTWSWNGGETTLKSFGAEYTGKLDHRYMQFMESLSWYHEDGNYLFVHAGFSDHDPFNDRNAMIWTRNEIYSNPVLTDKIIIHGHTPITVEQCSGRVHSNNRVINIDTGCVYDDPGYGTLTAIELTSGEKRLFQVGR